MPCPPERKIAALRAAFTADAACLGLHWIYDHGRLAQLAGDGRPLIFRDPDPAAYEGVPGYFAHGNRQAGDLSHYGEGMKVLALAIAEDHGCYHRTTYLRLFRGYFGKGYDGYLDHATKETLANLAADKTPPGTDDDQISAIAKLPPLVAALCSHPDLTYSATDAATATNEHPLARESARIAAAALSTALSGGALPEALQAGVASAGRLRDPLKAALEFPEMDPVAAAQKFGPACGLMSSLPLSWALLNRASSWEELLDGNILAGGDSCGRATLAGAMWGACHGISDGWFSRLKENQSLDQLIRRLVPEN